MWNINNRRNRCPRISIFKTVLSCLQTAAFGCWYFDIVTYQIRNICPRKNIDVMPYLYANHEFSLIPRLSALYFVQCFGVVFFCLSNKTISPLDSGHTRPPNITHIPRAAKRWWKGPRFVRPVLELLPNCSFIWRWPETKILELPEAQYHPGLWETCSVWQICKLMAKFGSQPDPGMVDWTRHSTCGLKYVARDSMADAWWSTEMMMMMLMLSGTRRFLLGWNLGWIRVVFWGQKVWGDWSSMFIVIGVVMMELANR